MTTQPELPFSGKQLAVLGANLALESADSAVEDWSVKAYALLMEYVGSHPKGYQFQCEQGRAYTEVHGLPEPPSKRAFGGLMTKLANNGLIKKVGYKEVSNKKAHETPSVLWEIV